MRTAILFLVLVVWSVFASADGWYWLPASNGYYVRANASGNDGWYYTRYNGCYNRAYQITNTTINVTNQAPANWKVNLVNALSAQRENDYYLQALRESGLMPEQQQATASSGYSTSTVVTQQGVGYHSLQSYAPNIGTVDIESLISKNARTIERMIDGTGQANAALSDRIGQIIEGQNEALKINAAGAALVASIQATQQSRTTTQTTQTVNGVVPVPPEPQEPGVVQAQMQATPTIDMVRAEAILSQKCGKCHINDAKGGFAFNRLDVNNYNRIWRALDPRAKKPMPPVDSGVHPLTSDELLAIAKAMAQFPTR